MVKRILADETALKSIKGRVAPPTGATESVYRLVAELFRNQSGKERDPDEKQ